MGYILPKGSYECKLVEIERTEKYLFALERLSMAGAKLVLTPLAQHFKLSLKPVIITEKERRDMEKVSYANAMGSIMYSMVCIRPDIAYASSLISMYMENPGKDLWEAVKWELKYLRGTARYSLVYKRSAYSTSYLTGYYDTDYCGDLD